MVRVNEGELSTQGVVSAALKKHHVDLMWPTPKDGVIKLDGQLKLHIDDQEVALPYFVKSQLRPSTVGILPTTLEPGTLILCHHITPAVGRLLRDRNLNYADAAGNAFIKAPGVRFHFEGFRPPPSEATKTGIFSTAAMPVVLAVLNRPELIHAPVRELRARTTVSLGTAHRVQTQLRGAGYDNTPQEDGSAPNTDKWRRLLEGWLSAFETVRENNTIDRYSSDLSQPDLVAAAPDLPAEVSGELAAHLAGADIIPATADLYVQSSASAVVRAARLRRDPEGPITVRRAIWTQLTTADSQHAQPNLAPSPVIYADIASISDPRTDLLAREWLIHDKNLRSFVVD